MAASRSPSRNSTLTICVVVAGLFGPAAQEELRSGLVGLGVHDAGGRDRTHGTSALTVATGFRGGDEGRRLGSGRAP